MKHTQIYLIFFLPFFAVAQQHSFNKHQKGISLEAFGVSPYGSLNFDYTIYRTQRGFLNLQAGIGIMSTIEDKWSFPHAVSYNFLINKSAKNKDPCKPSPKIKNETFVEVGYGQAIHTNQTKLSKIEYMMPILGFRTHFTKYSSREFYFKCRFTPNLTKYQSTFGGIVFGKVI